MKDKRKQPLFNTVLENGALTIMITALVINLVLGKLLLTVIFFGLCRTGSELNLYASRVNGGKMPVRCSRVTTIHAPMTKDTKSKWACDIIPVWLGNRIGYASIGDVLVLFGIVIAIASFFYI